MKKSWYKRIGKFLYGMVIILSCVLCILIFIIISDQNGKSKVNGADKALTCKFGMDDRKAAESLKYVCRMPQERFTERIREQIKAIAVEEYPVDTTVYDAETDREYRTAFKAVLLGRMPIRHEDGQESYFREIMPEVNQSSAEEYDRIIRKAFDYYYIDFDKDGFPELVIKPRIRNVHFGGIRILNYSSDDKRVYYFGEEYCWTGWSLLGAGQLYYVDGSSASTFRYGYREIDSSGAIIKEMRYSFTVSPEPSIYWLSDDNWGNYFKGPGTVEVEKEIWEETKQHFEEIGENAFPSITFEELFSGIE